MHKCTISFPYIVQVRSGTDIVRLGHGYIVRVGQGSEHRVGKAGLVTPAKGGVGGEESVGARV